MRHVERLRSGRRGTRRKRWDLGRAAETRDPRGDDIERGWRRQRRCTIVVTLVLNEVAVVVVRWRSCGSHRSGVMVLLYGVLSTRLLYCVLRTVLNVVAELALPESRGPCTPQVSGHLTNIIFPSYTCTCTIPSSTFTTACSSQATAINNTAP